MELEKDLPIPIHHQPNIISYPIQQPMFDVSRTPTKKKGNKTA